MPNCKVQLLYINGTSFEVPERYTGCLPKDEEKCHDIWKYIVANKLQASDICLSAKNQQHADSFGRLSGKKVSRVQLVFLRVSGEYM